MIRRRWGLRLGAVCGIELWLDVSWIPVLPLAAWSLAVVYFPENYPVFGAVLDWALGLAGAAALLLASLVHAAAHLVVQRGPSTAPRTMIIDVIGSVGCSCDGATSAIAGPLASILTAVAMLWAALNAGTLSRPLEALLGYFAIVNALLALLHLVPAAPFDAGSLLTILLIGFGVKRPAAECVSSALGAVLGVCLLLMGIWQVVSVSTQGGLFGAWVAVVGAMIVWANPLIAGRPRRHRQRTDRRSL